MQHSRRVKSGPRQQSSLVRLDDHSSSQAHQRSRVSVTGDIPLEDEEEIMLAAATISAPRPKPDRPVYLITADRNDPLRRTVRDVTQHHKPKHDVNDDRRVRDTEKELVDSTQPYTSNFNMTLTKLPRTKRAAELVRDRMKAEGIAMHAETYNLLLSKVADIRDPIAFEIFEDFKAEAQRDDATVRPDLVTLELLMRACERSSDYRRAFHIYTQMKELFGVYPDVPLYNTLIGFCAPLRDETTASFIMDEMKDRHVEPDVHTYNALMNVFVDAPYEVILQTFQDMVKRKLKPNRRTFNTLMKACQRIGDFDSVFQFFEELKRGLTPDVTTYNILFVACRDRIDFVLGTGKFSEQRRTKEHRELGTKAIAQLSRSLLTEMEEQGISPNTYTYNALLAVLSQCRDRRMFDVFAQMKEDEARSTVHSIHAAQHKYLPAGANVPRPPFAEMERMLEEAIATAANGDGDEGQDDRLSAAGVRPTLETYSTLIQGCHRMGLPDDAYRFFSEMKERNIKPDRGIFIKLIDVCALKTEKQRAFDLFQEARQSGMTPDTELYNSLINVLAECCDPRVIDIFNDLKYDRERLSIKPNQDSYNLMLKAALRMKSMDNALRLYEEMTSPSCVVAPDTTSYGILMDVCAACKDVRRASYFIEDLRRRNVAPSINTYSRFMQVFVACGDPGVVDVFENIKKHGPQPNLEAYTTLLTYYLHTKNDAIVGLFEEMQRDGVDPDLNAFNIMLNFAAAKGSPGTTANHQRAYKYLDELQKRRLNADIDTYNALIAVFAPSGADMIFKVFEDMAVCHVAPDATTLAILMKYPKGRSVLQQAVDRGLVKVDPALLASA